MIKPLDVKYACMPAMEKLYAILYYIYIYILQVMQLPYLYMSTLDIFLIKFNMDI